MTKNRSLPMKDHIIFTLLILAIASIFVVAGFRAGRASCQLSVTTTVEIP